MSDRLKQTIRSFALKAGFDAVGFTESFVPIHKEYFLRWIAEKKQADMTWIVRHTEKRLQPDLLMEGTRSGIVLATSYNHAPKLNHGFRVARYAYGEDYHHWIKDRLEKFAKEIQKVVGEGFQWRSFVDTGPLLERDLAVQAGLGWVGKNTCLIHKELGSFVYISVILCNLELNTSERVRNACGTCQLCVDACPTKAIRPYQLETSRCLAYQNIERRGKRDEKLRDKMGEWLVGCDLCQEVCPCNQAVPLTNNEEWQKSFQKYEFSDLKDILKMDEGGYRQKFKGSALSRVKYLDFMRNVFLVIANSGRKELLEDVQAWQVRHPGIEIEELGYCLNPKFGSGRTALNMKSFMFNAVHSPGLAP